MPLSNSEPLGGKALILFSDFSANETFKLITSSRHKWSKDENLPEEIVVQEETEVTKQARLGYYKHGEQAGQYTIMQHALVTMLSVDFGIVKAKNELLHRVISAFYPWLCMQWTVDPETSLVYLREENPSNVWVRQNDSVCFPIAGTYEIRVSYRAFVRPDRTFGLRFDSWHGNEIRATNMLIWPFLDKENENACYELTPTAMSNDIALADYQSQTFSKCFSVVAQPGMQLRWQWFGHNADNDSGYVVPNEGSCAIRMLEPTAAGISVAPELP